MKTLRRVAAALLVILMSSGPAFPQPGTRPSFDWFVGTWDVTYDDAFLGPVQGQAKVTQSLDGSVYVRYLITDARDGTTYDLTAFNVRQQGTVVTMELPMGGPTAAVTAEGPAAGPAAATPPPSARSLDVPVGADLRATLQGTRATARVGVNPAVANPRLRLVRTGGRLDGEWIVQRDSATGFKGARLGRRDVEVVPGPAATRREIMRGPEVWQTARMVVQDARRLAWQATPRGSATSTGTARVGIRGSNLPSTAGRSADVRFTTPLLTPDNAQVVPATADTIAVPVDVDVRAVPGPKSFVVTDPGTRQQANGVWVFDWPVLSATSLSFARKSRADHYEPTTILYPGELFYVEVDAAAGDPGNARFYGIETTHPEPVQFHLVRDTNQRTKYRAGPFLLLTHTEPIPRGSGAVETQQIPLDATALVSPTPARPFVVRAEVGERLRTYHIAAQPDERAAVALAAVAEEGVGEGRYQTALAKARELRKLYPDNDRYVISRFAVLEKGLARRTVVTEADHAALIVLVDELAAQVASMQRWHQRTFSKTELVAYGRALGTSAQRRIPEPLFVYEVPDHAGTGTISLDAALAPFNLQQAFGNDLPRRDDYIARAVAAAKPQLVSHLGQARTRLDQVDISKPEDLFRVVKPAYGAIATPLVQTLVRRSRPDRGEPAHPRWVADEPGRAAVRGIADFLGAIAADDQLAAYEWAWLSIVASPAIVAGGLVAMTAGGGAALAMSTLGLALSGTELTHNALKLSSAMEQRDIAYDLAPVAGYDAYHRERRQVGDLKLATAISGASVILDALGTTAAIRGLAASGHARIPTRSAMDAAVTQALDNGVDSLSPAARTNLAFALESAVETARTKGLSALTPMEQSALRAAFPDGIPADVATTLKMNPADPNFVIKVNDSTVSLSPFPSRQPSAPSVTPAPPVAPQQSSNPLVRRLYGEAEATARLGTPEAQARMVRLEQAAADWERLPPAAKGTVQDAIDTFARLRSQNPALAAMDEAEALAYFNFHSQRRVTSLGGANRKVLPEELVAEFVLWRGGPRVPPDQLARAANISTPNAEAAAFAADARIWPSRPGGPPSPPPPRRVTDPDADTRVTDVNAKTADLSRPPTPSSSGPAAAAPGVDDARRIEIAERLKQMGLAPEYAEVAGIVPAARGGDVRAGAAAAAMNSGIPADRVMQNLRMNRQQLEPLLDDYLRRFEVPNDAQRRAILARYLGDPPPAGAPVPPAPSPAPPSAAPRGLEPAPAPAPEARRQVEASLRRMGVPEDDIKTLPLDRAIARTGGRADEAAAGLSRRADVDSRTAARALDTDERGFAGLVDQYEAKTRPHVHAAERAAEIGSRLRADGVAEPHTTLFEARQGRIDAALRDVGIERADPAATTRLLDPESVIVGEALSRGVAADVLQARRGLTTERLSYHLDDYLLNGRGIESAAERARHKTQLLSRPPTETSGDTVRLSPSVIAAEHELADALALLGVDRVQAAHRAANLANLARNDAHQAIVVGAWQSRAPPSAVRRQFGLTDAQMARGLDGYLQNYLGMRDPAARNRFIADQFFGRGGQPTSPQAVAAMLAGTPAPPPPLRAVAAANPPPVPIPVPPPRPRPAPGPSADLADRFGPPMLPRGLRLEERLPDGNVRPNPAAVEVRPGAPVRLNPDRGYLWLIDERGRLLLAQERFVVEGGRPVLNAMGEPGRLGHPAITGGRPARIAGELRYVEGRGWVIDNNSGRYSRYNNALTPDHLENAADLFRQAGVRVQTRFLTD